MSIFGSSSCNLKEIIDIPSFHLSSVTKYSSRTTTICDDTSGDDFNLDSAFDLSSNELLSVSHRIGKCGELGFGAVSDVCPTSVGTARMSIRRCKSDPILNFQLTNLARSVVGPALSRLRARSEAPTPLKGSEIHICPPTAAMRFENDTVEASGLKPMSPLQLFSGGSSYSAMCASSLVYDRISREGSGAGDRSYKQMPRSPVPPAGATAYIVPGPRGASDIIVEGEEELNLNSSSDAEKMLTNEKNDSVDLSWWKKFSCWNPIQQPPLQYQGSI